MRTRNRAGQMGLAAITVASLWVVTACSAEPEPASVAKQTTETVTVTQAPESYSAAAAFVPTDLREQVASLMVVGVANYEEAKAALEQGAGGLFIPSWADPAILTQPGRDINALREEYDRPFTVAIDFEGGRVQRHSEVLGSFPTPRDIAAQSPEVTQGTGYDIGVSLRAHGINVDYAPLLDLDVSGLDIVGDRAFGHDPKPVEEASSLFVRGLLDAGVTPTFKHFPGHGRASGDTHDVLAVTPPIEELAALDLKPYAAALAEFPQASVMVGHMVVPGLGDGQTPSSLNPAAYELLRSGAYPGGRPFQGVAVTDDLSGMRAITDMMSAPDAVRHAIAAGADQALWSSGEDLGAVIDGTVAAVESGGISRASIVESATRVQQQYLDTGVRTDS